MARIRCVKPEFWTAEQIMECSPIARLAFIGLWNFCDDGGNHPASAKTLKAEVFPGDDITVATIETLVTELTANALMIRYEVEGKRYWHVTGWHHQKIERPNYKHPDPQEGTILDLAPPPPEPCPSCAEDAPHDPPNGAAAANARRAGDDGSTSVRRAFGARSPPEGKGEEGSTPNPPSSLRSEAPPAPPAPKAAAPPKRATALSPGFEPNVTAVGLAAELGVAIAPELAKFRDYHSAHGKTMRDWQAAFRTWLRNAPTFGHAPALSPPGHGPPHPMSREEARHMAATTRLADVIDDEGRRKPQRNDDGTRDALPSRLVG